MNNIPKTIHYIWVGSPIPEAIQKQIEKNNQFFSGYTIKVWTEENMPPLNTFATQAYADKKWAFVSDYLRFKILYEEGGIYLDTDMDVLKLLDDLLEDRFFSGWNRGARDIYTGIVGAVKEHPFIEEILKVYEDIPQGEYSTSPEIMTQCFDSYADKTDLTILASQYFYPLLDGERRTSARLKDAYTNHLWHESWRSYVPLRRFLRRLGIMKLYHHLKFKIQ